MLGIVAHVLDEDVGLLADLFFERDRLLDHELLLLGGKKEARELAVDPPAAAQLPRPRNLHIGLDAATSDTRCARRQPRADDDRQVDFSRYRADLPLDRR